MVPEFIKNDKDKPRYSLLPWGVLEKAVIAMEEGSTLYGDNNWQSCDDSTRYFDAFMRHITAHRRGQIMDDSGNSALSHAVASLLIYAALEIDK